MKKTNLFHIGKYVQTTNYFIQFNKDQFLTYLIYVMNVIKVNNTKQNKY